MKRHKSLQPLSRHHHHALVRALEIRRAGELPAGERAAAMRATAKKFLKFYEKNGRVHFREEEEVLLPACARHVRIDEEPAMVRMLAEHAIIRARIGDLARALEEKQDVEPLLSELGQRLHDHVRFEEEELFPRVERILGEAGLAEIAPHLTEMHGKSCDVDL
jgi:hemerythrin-like domain-containing protein